MRNPIIYFITTLLLFSCTKNQENSPILIDVSSTIVSPKNYIVPKTSRAIVIDGIAQEEAWHETPYTDSFIDIEGIKTPKFDTKIKMLWDNDYLYVYSKMKEPHIWASLKQRDTIVFYNNDFEVFIDASGKGKNYGEIEVNAYNTIWDLFLANAYRVDGKANFEWNLEQLKSAVHIEGSLNNPNDIDNYWSVEMAIPIAPFLRYTKNNKILDGEQWRINFSRVEWNHDIINETYYRKKENGQFLPEYNWVWSNQKVINMHEPEKWGYLQFSEQSSPKGISFKKDEDEIIKQVVYALFRKTQNGELKSLSKNKIGFSRNLSAKYSNDNSFKGLFHKTNFGYEITINNPITNNTFCINQKGELKQL